jgi:carboxylesterase
MAAMGSTRFFRDPRRHVVSVLKYVMPWQIPNGECDLGDPDRLLALHSYARRPTVCLESMFQFLRRLEASLPQVQVPTLLLHGRRDRTVPVENAPFILERLGSADKQLHWMERSGHALTVDLERVELNARVRQWLDAH